LSSTQIPERIEQLIRSQGLIEPGGEILCLVSGGADSTCLWHALSARPFVYGAEELAQALALLEDWLQDPR
jgi:hypothetical protein